MNNEILTIRQKIGLLSTIEELRNNNRTSGARLLVLAMLERALDDFFTYHPIRRRGRTGTLIYNDAQQWLSSKASYFLSFEWICLHLG